MPKPSAPRATRSKKTTSKAAAAAPDLTPAEAPVPPPPPQQGSRSDPAETRRAAIEIARSLKDDKCDDVIILDVRKVSQVCDYILIASGTSDRQMRAAADHAADLAGTLGAQSFRRSTDDRATWIVVDCVDVVIHVFEPNTRAHYDLEMLWGDAQQVDWERPAGKKGKAADRE